MAEAATEEAAAGGRGEEAEAEARTAEAAEMAAEMEAAEVEAAEVEAAEVEAAEVQTTAGLSSTAYDEARRADDAVGEGVRIVAQPPIIEKAAATRRTPVGGRPISPPSPLAPREPAAALPPGLVFVICDDDDLPRIFAEHVLLPVAKADASESILLGES